MPSSFRLPPSPGGIHTATTASKSSTSPLQLRVAEKTAMAAKSNASNATLPPPPPMTRPDSNRRNSGANSSNPSNHRRPIQGSPSQGRNSTIGGSSNHSNGLFRKNNSYKTKFGQKVEVSSGTLLEGEELEEYCKKRGLCPLCAQSKVRKRVFKLFKKNKWEAVTQLSKDKSTYLVYKGFCVKPDCFTLEQAKRLCGEIKGDVTKKKSSMKTSGHTANSMERRKRTTANPFARNQPIAEAQHAKQRFSVSKTPLDIDESGHESDSQRGTTHRRSDHSFPPLDIKEQCMKEQRQGIATANGNDSESLSLLPVINRIIQGIKLDSSQRIKVLDLSEIELRFLDLQSLMDVLRTNTSLMVLNLEKCNLSDEHMEVLGAGLANASDMPLIQLYLRSNKIQNEGIDALCPFLETSHNLEKIDLSRNNISTMGGVAVFNAFRRNRLVKIKAINLSHNELWDIEQNNYGIKSFLAKNRSLKNLNLEGNFLHDESVEALCVGLQQAGEHATLQRLHLAWNSIGDDGAIALGECLSVNQSLQFIDLAENRIQNPGGRALLAALDHNPTLREISGLWRNKIDRRFVIVAIRRLLLSREEGAKDHGNVLEDGSKHETSEQAPLGMEAHRIGPHPNSEFYNTAGGSDEIPISHDDDDVSDLSDDPLDHDSVGDENAGLEQSKRQFIVQRDLERDRSLKPFKLLPSLGNALPDIDAGSVEPVVETLMETNQEVTHNFDRVTFFQSAPLVFFEKELGIHRGIPMQDGRYEQSMLEEVFSEVAKTGVQIEVKEEIATMDRFSSFFAEQNSHILHFSCYGQSDCIALENGYGSLQTLPVDGLRRLIAAVGSNVSFVFVSSCHAKMIGEAFVDAGIPHVVCCQKGHDFRDPVATEFIQSFYKEAAKRRKLSQAFETAVQKIVSSLLSKNMRQVDKRFHLLPSMPDIRNYHDVPVFFNQIVPATKEKEPCEAFSHIPPVPSGFIGREIDMYEILESVRVDDIVKITGTPGYGKESVIAAVANYAMQRRKMFSVDDIFWIPAPEGVHPEPDSLYGDLTLCCNLIRTSKDDIWDGNDALLECRDRLQIELEDLRIILVVDDRSFSSKGCQDALEKFISFILNTATAKVIMITARGNESSSLLSSSTHGSRIEESTIEVSTLDFRSTALLFGANSKFISSNACPGAHSAQEFAELLEPPFIARMPDPSVVSSQRRTDLFARMGCGLPSAVTAAAASMDKNGFIELMKIANKPEFHVESLSELEAEFRRRTNQKEKAVADKNYMRAADLDIIIKELEAMRPEFPTLKDLKEEEQLMKADLADAVANRRYDAANDFKRDLLTLKKKIMRERRLMPDQSDNPNNKLNDFQAHMESMIEGANDSFKLDGLDRKISFKVRCDDRDCMFSIYYGDIDDFKHPSEAKGIVYWTNEACDLGCTVEGQQLLERAGEVLQKDIGNLPIIAATPYGSARCGTGNAVIVGPSHHYRAKLQVPLIILTVGPFPSKTGNTRVDTLLEDDEDYLHYSKIMLRSCYRSSMVLARHSELQAMGISILTTNKKGIAYEETVRLGLHTLLEEYKFTHLKDIHIIAKTPKEASLMVNIMQSMGYEIDVG